MVFGFARFAGGHKVRPYEPNVQPVEIRMVSCGGGVHPRPNHPQPPNHRNYNCFAYGRGLSPPTVFGFARFAGGHKVRPYEPNVQPVEIRMVSCGGGVHPRPNHPQPPNHRNYNCFAYGRGLSPPTVFGFARFAGGHKVRPCDPNVQPVEIRMVSCGGGIYHHPNHPQPPNHRNNNCFA